jgi:hypothetical protein
MAIQISGTTVVNNSRQLQNIASIDTTTKNAISAAGVGGLGHPVFDNNALYFNYQNIAGNTTGTAPSGNSNSGGVITITGQGNGTFFYANMSDVGGGRRARSQFVTANTGFVVDLDFVNSLNTSASTGITEHDGAGNIRACLYGFIESGSSVKLLWSMFNTVAAYGYRVNV